MYFKLFAASFLSLLLLFCLSLPVRAHFGMIIPSTPTAVDKNDARLAFDISFSHPSAGQGMNMDRPAAFSVHAHGKSENLVDSLQETKIMGHKAWRGAYEIKKPGVYFFAVTPEPYFEAAEDCFIIHYAKTVVAAFGNEDGWDTPLGLPVEIVPLTRPFGNFSGNVFQGLVLKNGKPLPDATVEVESLNREPRHEGPNAYYENQVVKTDANGVFTVGIPWAGWWGFAALSDGESQMEFQGVKKDVELGGILWLQFAAPRIVK